MSGFGESLIYIWLILKILLLTMQQSQFKSLKQEAKSLLQKGAYRMSLNKYKQLIDNKPKDIDPRSFSILHLNAGIASSFIGNQQSALQYINRAILIDPNYDKAYFRRIQLLWEMERYEEALQCPQHVKNQQIRGLLKKIEIEYSERLVELEWASLERKLKDAITTNKSGLIEEINHVLYSKYNENKNINELINQGIFLKYLCFLKEANAMAQLQKYYELIYKLFLKTEINQQPISVNEKFWDNVIIIEECKVMAKLLSYCPILRIRCCSRFVKFYCKNIKKILNDKPSVNMLIKCLGLNQKFIEVESENLEVLYDLYLIVLDSFEDQLESSEKFDRTEFIEVIANCILGILQTNKFNVKKNKNILNQLFVNSFYMNKSKDSTLREEESQRILQLLGQQDQSISILYLINTILIKLENIKQIKKLTLYGLSYQNCLNEFNKSTNEIRRLLLACILVKISFPEDQSTVLKIEQIFRIKSTCNIMRYLQIQLMSSLCITNINNTKNMLRDTKLSGLFMQQCAGYKFSKETKIQDIKFHARVVFLLNLFVFSHQEKQVKRCAEQMGVNPQQIIAARKLQGEKTIIQDYAALKMARDKFIKYFLQSQFGFLETLARQCKNSTIETKKAFNNIISTFCKNLPNKFYATHFIEISIEVFDNSKQKGEKNQVYIFFSTICKKCNTQILLYKHQEKIVNILLEALENADHELIIFQSLLSLLNFSTLDIKIPIRQIAPFLIQENEYLIHGSCEILNNLLLKGKNQYQQLSAEQIKIIKLHYKHYNEILEKNQKIQKPETDYSHPHKIYATLVSLMMVLDDYQKIQIRELNNFDEYVSRCKQMNVVNGAMLLMKGIFYFDSKGKLSKKYLKDCGAMFEYLQKNHADRYTKMLRLIR